MGLFDENLKTGGFEHTLLFMNNKVRQFQTLLNNTSLLTDHIIGGSVEVGAGERTRKWETYHYSSPEQIEFLRKRIGVAGVGRKYGRRRNPKRGVGSTDFVGGVL